MYRTSTVRTKWKKFGSRNGHQWGWSIHQGKWHKRRLHKAWRRYWNKYALVYQDDPVLEPRKIVESYVKLASIVNWKNW